MISVIWEYIILKISVVTKPQQEIAILQIKPSLSINSQKVFLAVEKKAVILLLNPNLILKSLKMTSMDPDMPLTMVQKRKTVIATHHTK